VNSGAASARNLPFAALRTPRWNAARRMGRMGGLLTLTAEWRQRTWHFLEAPAKRWRRSVDGAEGQTHLRLNAYGDCDGRTGPLELEGLARHGRAILEINILISGLISPSGKPARLIDAWLERIRPLLRPAEGQGFTNR
jgi:hypothetical protein